MSRVSGVAELVRLLVLRGAIAPGERLVEVQLRERLRVDRRTLREALRRLEGEGLLVAGESGGMRVIRLDGEELTATLEVRAALEALSAGLAAGRVRDGRVARGAVAALEALAAGEDPSAGSRGDALLADRAFHRGIDALAGNALCRDALNRVWDRLLVAAAPVAGGPPEDHREILAAIVAGDAQEASALARRHVVAA
jgi:DNA-binding GntR family transcriptional regulator